MDTLLLDVCDFPMLCMNEKFWEAFPQADDVAIEFYWEEPEPEVGFSGGFDWQAYVGGVDVTYMMTSKDIHFVEEALNSYTEAYYG